MNAVVLQGDASALFLFISVLDFIFKRMTPIFSIATHHNTHLADLGFADDMALLNNIRENATAHVKQFAYLSRLTGQNIDIN